MTVINLITILSFLGIYLVFLFGYLIARALTVGDSGKQADRLYGGGRRSGTVQREVRAGMIFGPMTEALAAQVPQMEQEAKNLELELRRAGYYKPSARIEYLAIRNAGMLAVILVTAAICALLGPERSLVVKITMVVGLVVAAMVYALPRLIIASRGARRVRQIQFGLPDALDMIAMSVSGGLSLYDAMESVSHEIEFTHPDLSFELDLVRQQTEMGSLEQAFRQFAHRIDAPEVRQMATLVTQSERLGTNVVAALREHADNIRRAQRARADERASKVGVKMLFPLVLFMAPSVFILLWGPAILELRDFRRNENREGGVLYQPDEIDFQAEMRRRNQQLDGLR